MSQVPPGSQPPDLTDRRRGLQPVGAGATLPRGRLTPDRLRAAVHQTIAARPGALRVAAAFANFGPSTAADVVEEFVPPPAGA